MVRARVLVHGDQCAMHTMQWFITQVVLCWIPAPHRRLFNMLSQRVPCRCMQVVFA